MSVPQNFEVFFDSPHAYLHYCRMYAISPAYILEYIFFHMTGYLIMTLFQINYNLKKKLLSSSALLCIK